MIVDGLDLLDLAEGLEPLRNHAFRRECQALIGRGDVLCRKVGAIVELDARADLERVGQACRIGLPAFGEIAFDFGIGARLEAQQRRVVRRKTHQRGEMVGAMAVEVGRVVGHGIAKDASLLRRCILGPGPAGSADEQRCRPQGPAIRFFRSVMSFLP